MATGTLLQPRGAGVADARGRRAASSGWVGGKSEAWLLSVCKSILASIDFFGASFARIREHSRAFCFPEDRALVW